MRDIRIGLYSAGLRTYWAQFPGLKARLESYNRFIAEKLSAYGEVFNFGLLDNADRSEEAADYFGANRVDLLFLHSATYFTSDMVLPVHRACKIPAVVLNLQPSPQIDYSRTDTGEWLANCVACPVPEVSNAFERAGIAFQCVSGLLGLTDTPEGALAGAYFDPKEYMRITLRLFDHIRSRVGWQIELLHDVHERLAPIDAVGFAKEMEQYKLFFLEDLFAPEQIDWFRMVRQQCATPLAMGELFNNANEWTPLISNRLIDFIRVHISQIGGLTPAKKLASTCEMFGVRTAWHGPNDITPIGVAAHLHVDLTSPSFGIQEFAGFSDNEKAVFPGCPEVRGGYLYANDRPGLGIDIDEAAAAKFPYQKYDDAWLRTRLPDGSSVRA